MELYLARQPIFNKNLHVEAYELLYKSAETSMDSDTDRDKEALIVINNSTLSFNFKNLTNNKVAYINFTPGLIRDEVPTFFIPSDIVVEISEGSWYDTEFISAISYMRDKGYKVALTGFYGAPIQISMLNFVDIVKVDFSRCSKEDRESIVSKYINNNMCFIADKVVSRQEFDDAVKYGYELFQGTFFAEPVTLTGKDIEPADTVYLQVLNELTKEGTDFNRLTKMIKSDVAMSYKLLRIINTVAYYSSFRINSIRQAVVTLGIVELRKWILILMVEKSSKNKPIEILRQSLLRARLYEIIAKQTGRISTSSEAFLVGMFSMIDALMDRSKEDIIEELPVNEDIKDGILGKSDYYNEVESIVMSHENGDWSEFERLCIKNSILPQIIIEDYYDAAKWIDEITNESEKV